jgi:nucleoside-diphosphate-sugar epimerase
MDNWLQVMSPMVSQWFYADIARAREVLGYAPRYTIEEGLRALADWGGKPRP